MSQKLNNLKGRILPHLHLHVPMKVGMYAAEPKWSNPDLDPIAPELRVWGALDYWVRDANNFK